MNCCKLVIVTAFLALACKAQDSPNPAAVLKQTGERLLNDLDQMPRYTCVQTITRTYYGRLVDPKTARRLDCSGLIAQHDAGKPKLAKMGWDRLRLEVALVNGDSVYSWVGAPKFSDNTLESLSGNGPLGSGDFGPFLSEILRRTDLQFNDQQTIDGRRLLEYAYEMPRNRSGYKVRVGDGWELTGYSGALLLDAEAQDVAQLTVRTDALSDQNLACQIISEIDYERKPIHGRMVLVPRETRLDQVDHFGGEALSHTSFENCREYTSKSRLIFDNPTDGDPSKSSGEPSAAEALTEIPSGLKFDARIITPIDSAKTAVGDPVDAILRTPIRDKHHAVLAPAGAQLHGRIRNFEWWSDRVDYFEIKVQLDTVDLGRISLPIHAATVRDTPRSLSRTSLSSTYQGDNNALIFPGDRLFLKQLDAHWITVDVPDAKK